MASIADPCGERRIALTKLLMILTSHRLDCFSIAMDLLDQTGSLNLFDRVVLLLNGVHGAHRRYVDHWIITRPDVHWDIIEGPRGRGPFISNLQNECVRKYPGALYFKIDEDTFVCDGWVNRLTRAYEEHREDPALSLITPVIPNSGFGSHYLLTAFPELAEEYRSMFPQPMTPDCDGPTWLYPQIAEWVTRKFLDLRVANDRLRALASPKSYQRFAYRFSINCIVYDYRHWTEMGGVPKFDEVGWGDWIPAHNKTVVLVTDLLVHHYSFFVQQDWLDRTTLLEDIRMTNLPDTCPPGYTLWRHLPQIARTARQLPDIIRRRLGHKS